MRYRESGSRQAPSKTVSRFVAGTQSLEERLPGYAHHDRPSQGAQRIEVSQEGEVVVQILPESDARIQRNRLGRDPLGDRLSHTKRSEERRVGKECRSRW